MRILVVGGSGSGKSAVAERLACKLSNTRTYFATMHSDGTEAKARIARHRAQREDMGFVTLERPQSLLPLAPSRESARDVALVDDLGNLAANALFCPDGTMCDHKTVLEQLTQELNTLARSYAHVVVVGNEVGSEGAPYHDATLTWIYLQGALCCHAASTFDTVIEVVAGIPSVVKGELP